MRATCRSEPCSRMKECAVEPSGTCVQDTLETSLCANSAGDGASAVSPKAEKRLWNAVARLFPTDDCPAHRYPMPLARWFLNREQGSLLHGDWNEAGTRGGKRLAATAA
jgi:hypothetical protein